MKNLATFVFFAAVTMFTASFAQARSLTAELHGTKPDSKITGEVRFDPTENGLKVTAHVEGVPAGRHGFHIHEKGDCGDAGNSAGGHFNPDKLPHGDAAKNGIGHAHAGDLGNIEIGADGKGDLEKVIPGLGVDAGKYSGCAG